MIENIIDLIGEAISAMWFYFEHCLNSINAYGVVVGVVASAIFVRFIIMPIFGGHSIGLGSDSAKPEVKSSDYVIITPKTYKEPRRTHTRRPYPRQLYKNYSVTKR